MALASSASGPLIIYDTTAGGEFPYWFGSIDDDGCIWNDAIQEFMFHRDEYDGLLFMPRPSPLTE